MSDPIAYPHTDREDVSDELFGIAIADPYRWLETDVRESDRVRAWVEAENAVTDAYLDTLPGRAAFTARMRSLFDYERFGVPVKKGGRYFYLHNSGLQNQPVLYVRDSAEGEGRVLIDPNAWAEDGATALAEWLPSEDGTQLLYAVQDGGTDWRTVRVMDVATGAIAADEVRWVKFSAFAWARNGAGFFYSRFPEPAARAEYQAVNLNHAIYFHTLGSDQAQDRLVFATPDRPRLNSVAEITDDGNWLLVTSSEGTDDRYELTVIDLTSARMTRRIVVRGLENHWSLAGNVGSIFYFVTDTQAPRRRIVTMDVASMSRQLREIVPQSDAVLEGAGIVGGVLFAQYLVDVKTEVRRFDLSGAPLGSVALPGIGSVAGFGGEAGDNETFYAFTSFATPTTIYRYDVAADQSSVWAAPQVAFDPDDYAVEQTFFTSKDGTRVPMFVVGRKDLPAEPQPTILYGYGGFNIPVAPAFSTARLAWIEQGGVFAVANIRGGGEYGKEWHDGGRLANKQNSFDDFIAAAEHLIAQGITSREKLAVQGGSNGGLLVGAVVNQRPDLFAAALPAVGVMDMLRFDKWTAGRYWVDDYGSPAEEAAFRVLHGYSPYHNIQPGRAYPAILVTTADTDDRVVPAHSFKYVAALQHADIGGKPHLVRIETRAGHGSGKPTDKIIEEAADTWAFAAKWTGLDVG
ncbi:prolyl oligopeptidase family protein [Hephaestia sp. GCM10023244]|uniref:prolyl oligopeptidase family serine peptidase n=1 Tax=unclassified Hephaestia TaxID=2631281 RepID=UPI0020778D28|nr:prolyl oligopeptidase family serine peptidase [Hephaestia sp. MAHUQ-44]MCM8730802.1 prolyl oligopeptidase family serine peptidase [Hephaestia sp. MAHUQ-44]